MGVVSLRNVTTGYFIVDFNVFLDCSENVKTDAFGGGGYPQRVAMRTYAHVLCDMLIWNVLMARSIIFGCRYQDELFTSLCGFYAMSMTRE